MTLIALGKFSKKKNQISKAAPLIQSLIDAGLRCDIKWINEALELIGEELGS